MLKFSFMHIAVSLVSSYVNLQSITKQRVKRVFITEWKQKILNRGSRPKGLCLGIFIHKNEYISDNSGPSWTSQWGIKQESLT